MIRSFAVLIIIVVVCGCGRQKKTDSVRTEDPKKGEELFNRVGCAACHSVTGESRYGPPLNAILDKEVPVIRDGRTDTVKIDRQYILRSLQNPGIEKVLSYRKRMMPVLNLSQEEIDYIVDYLMYINKHQTGNPAVRE
jgi:mono/diheme cytochrome c family protein